MLACGPYFDESGMMASLVLLLLVKPLSYYAYVRAFRHRVSKAIPMTVGQAIGIAAARAGLGVVLVGGGAWAIANWNLSQGLLGGWVYLYLSRIFAWWIVGRMAGLRRWRMIGWIVGGEAINIVFDLAVVFGLAAGVLPAVGAVAMLAAFIGVLEWRGRRPELLARFSPDPRCPVCQYNLTGNLSGICPECGTPVAAGLAAGV
jgi:hypothetical protein